MLELGYTKEIFVYSMGVDTNLFTTQKKDLEIRKKYNIENEFLLFVGGIIERKGIRFLINAMPLVIEKFPSVKLLVIGDGNLKGEMMELTIKLKICDHVIFTGAIPHNYLPPYFATADIFILPSFSEGWPVVVMEALSSETIAVVSDIPVFSDHKDKDKLFNIVATGSSESIANCIIKILNNKNTMSSKKVFFKKLRC